MLNMYQVERQSNRCYDVRWFMISFLFAPISAGSLVAQWVRGWPTDLAVMGSGHACKQGSIAHTFIIMTSAHHPDMTEILLNRRLLLLFVDLHTW